MATIKFENREFEIDHADYIMHDNNPIDIIIYAHSDTLESIAEFAKGPYNIDAKKGEPVSCAFYSHLEPFTLEGIKRAGAFQRFISSLVNEGRRW